jgi:branched-chain amino acid transport system permease protein
VLGSLIVVELTVRSTFFHTSGTLLLTAAVLFVLIVAPKGLLGYFGAITRTDRLRDVARPD